MPGTFNEPESRNEAILQNMLGANNELGEPQSRIEELLMQLLEQGSGGSEKIEIPDSIADVVLFFIDSEKSTKQSNMYSYQITDSDMLEDYAAFISAIAEANQASKLVWLYKENESYPLNLTQIGTVSDAYAFTASEAYSTGGNAYEVINYFVELIDGEDLKAIVIQCNVF